MTKTTLALTALAFAFAFSGPAGATVSKSVVPAAVSGTSVVFADEMEKCKEGEIRDAETKKCKKKEG